VEQWPAHLHIDLLGPFSELGFGRQLIERFWRRAREQCAKGIHLGMAALTMMAGNSILAWASPDFPSCLTMVSVASMGEIKTNLVREDSIN